MILQRDIIPVTICSDHTWECSTNVIGRSGEDLITQLQILLLTEEIMYDFSNYLEFEKPNGEKFRAENFFVITRNEKKYLNYLIPKFLLNESGKLQVQFVSVDDEGSVWRSFIKTFYVEKSINASEGVPDYTKANYIDVGDIATFNLEQFNQMKAVLNSGKQLVVVDCQTDYYTPIHWTETIIVFASDSGHCVWNSESPDACEWIETNKHRIIGVTDIEVFSQYDYNRMRSALNEGYELEVVDDITGDRYKPICWDTTRIHFMHGYGTLIWDDTNKEVGGVNF